MRIRLLLTVVGALAIALLAACGGSSGDEGKGEEMDPIVLNLVTPWAVGVALGDVGDKEIMDAIAEKTNGLVTVVRAAGPDSVPTTQQMVPLRDGVFDIGVTTGAYHPDFTAIGNGWNAAKGSLRERYDCGMFDVMDDFYMNEVGVKFLGEIDYAVGQRIYTTKPIDPNVGRLDGLQLRAAGATSGDFIRGLGVTPINMPIGDVYEALDKGLVDGGFVGGGAQLAVQFGWHEKLKYVVDQTVGWSGGMILMNLDVWNALTPTVQQQVLDAVFLAEERALPKLAKLDADAVNTMVASGMQLVTLSDAVEAQWAKTYIDLTFESLAQNEPAEYVARMREAADCLLAK